LQKTTSLLVCGKRIVLLLAVGENPFSGQIVAAKKQNGAKLVWQPRFWGHFIRDEEDLQRHLDYIHYNPVQHG
jgi:putative transposase